MLQTLLKAKPGWLSRAAHSFDNVRYRRHGASILGYVKHADTGGIRLIAEDPHSGLRLLYLQ